MSPTQSPADGELDSEPTNPPPGADVTQRDGWLADTIARAMAGRPALHNSRIGIYIEDLTSGRVVYQRDANGRYSVASCAKLITAAASLRILGPDFRPRSEVLANAVSASGAVLGDLYLRGRADPDLDVADVARLADQLVHAGITRVSGRLVVDDTYFDDQMLPRHFDEQPDEQAWFRAPVSALSPAFSSFWVIVRPARAGQGLAFVAIDPPGAYARIENNQLVTQPSGRNRIRLDIGIKRGRLALSLSGQLRSDSGVRRFRRRVPDPRVFAGSLFAAALAERGIEIGKTSIGRGRAPDTASPLAWIDGAPVAISVRHLGKRSNNFVAEMLLKTIGAETRQDPGPAGWTDGLTAVRQFLDSEVGLVPGSYRYGNGSGLFDATEFSPMQLARVLATAYKSPRHGPDFIASLAIAGVDGTLHHRMRNTPARGLVRAKSGTLATVSALSGYAALDGRTALAFVIIINGLPGQGKAGRTARKQARDLQDRIADALIGYLSSARPAAGNGRSIE
ncbi:MAG: D-alanyl-D-alanine carboxypeptidase/D-alanyl-D-alanine-endopeptidase [Proteobacteria bacterium]|nr:D-alanyl-D-alanine carboxypeptidase/D-alanyl-D-alanine-endopeptidase [Pseudomonadota bacterium]